jgi:hypothetical protein
MKDPLYIRVDLPHISENEVSLKPFLRFLPVLVLSFFSLFLPACSGSSSGTSVSGVVYAPNGVDPIAGAQVSALPNSANGAYASPAMVIKSLAARTTVSGPDGRFTLTNLEPGAYTLLVSRGMFQASSPLSVAGEEELVLPVAQTTLPGGSAGNGGGEGGAGSAPSAPRFAVVTGSWDEMANVLAKFGMGQVDAHGTLVLGTETFDLYVSESYRPVWNDELESFDYLPYPESYLRDTELFANLAAMRRYDVIVINCGADQLSLYEPGEPGVTWNLREFVRLGGRLYVTDLSNNFVEQAFPEFIRFQAGGTESPSVPEPLCAAWVGWGDITSEAAVRDATLAAWLGSLGALNDNGSLHIEDFLGGWAAMAGPEPTGEGGQVKVWVEGPVTIDVPDPEMNGQTLTLEGVVLPLTVSFPFGNGKVIYTSYHTAGMPHPGFTPQERVLEYLLLI